jgi:hypothetical protein
MQNYSRRTKIFAVFLSLIIVGTIIAWFSSAETGVPKDFAHARQQGALIAQDIVGLSDESTNDLVQVNNFDKSGDYTDALTLTTSIIAKNQTLRDEAISLSGQIETMTKALPGISSPEARQDALNAISSRLALISELMNYSSDLQNLLVTLQNHFTGTAIKRGDVETIVNQINTDVNAINNFNAQAQQSMTAFDSLTSK